MASSKRHLYESVARVAKALSNPHRLQLLELAAQCEQSVEQLALMTGLSVANASQHLKILKSTGLLQSRRNKHSVHYSVATHEVPVLFNLLRSIAETYTVKMDLHANEVVSARDKAQPRTADEVVRALRKGQILLVDVRPAREYHACHIRGARNIPLEELSSRLRNLPKDLDIYVYCRGPFCLMAVEAVATLRGRGYRAYPIHEGLPEWKAAGLPVGGTVTEQSSQSAQK